MRRIAVLFAFTLVASALTATSASAQINSQTNSAVQGSGGGLSDRFSSNFERFSTGCRSNGPCANVVTSCRDPVQRRLKIKVRRMVPRDLQRDMRQRGVVPFDESREVFIVREIKRECHLP